MGKDYCDLLIRPDGGSYSELLTILSKYGYNHVGILYNHLPTDLVNSIENYADELGLEVIRRIHIDRSRADEISRLLSKYTRGKFIFSMDMDIAEDYKKYIKYIKVLTYKEGTPFRPLRIAARNKLAIEVPFVLINKYVFDDRDELMRIIKVMRFADSHKSLIISSGAHSAGQVFPPRQLAYTVIGLLGSLEYYDYYLTFRW